MNSSTIDQMSNYLSTQEAAVFISKSESTVKRFITKIKNERPKDYKNKAFFKFEKLQTGHKKTLVEKSFLASEFNIATNDSVNDSLNSSNETLSKTLKATEDQSVIDILRKEIEYKNTQLDKKDQQIDQLIERQRESNILLAKVQEAPQIETPKKKWWSFKR